MKKFKLTDKIPNYNDMAFIHVYGCYYGNFIGDNNTEPTFMDILVRVGYDFSAPCPTYIVVEHPLNGVIYQIGNYIDDDEILEHGKTNGYA